MLQTVIVAVIVAGAFAWVVWTLALPRTARNRLRRLAGLGEAREPGGCPGAGSGCSGCCGGGGSAPTPH
ncbi:hypothetical protein [Azospirillum thermophilum]|uniref:Uncharacterized protein n=1 Tax=Azospirillum thermophilum TaxID=2202148 RepID=A0A2S2CWD4_9PROT|nr:hypothetical protein [Azospirillum thermophilum]AWK88786.1 hypothetical protein DEW08_22175 [Azospirillum thermophilum]